MRVTVNKTALRTAFNNQKSKFKEVLDDNIIPSLQGEKLNLLENIQDHPISDELDNQREVYGRDSLYGLIGFDAEGQDGMPQNDPVGDLLDIVDQTTIMPTKSSSITVQSTEIINAKYIVYITDNKDLDNDDRMRVPWGGAANWVRLIERGITGLGWFLRGTRFKTSRSGHGIQSRFRVREQTILKGRPYLADAVSKFKDSLNRRIQNSILTKTYYNVRDRLGRFRKL